MGDVLYRVYRDTTKEVPPVVKREEILRELHEAGGHVGITKVYRMARTYYYWPGMFEQCTLVVSECVSCKTMKGQLRSMPLKPTNKFGRPF